jgi:SOS response regulatory protein OraA/RecX
MTILSIKERDQGDGRLISLEIAGASAMSFHAAYLDPSWDVVLQPGDVLGEEEAAALNFAAECSRAESAALKLSARAEQTIRGLSYKLESRGFLDAAVKAVIRRLSSLGILDDHRFAEAYIRSRLHRHSGKVPSPQDLLSSLRNRGIRVRDAEEALRKILDRETEEDLLRRYMEKMEKSVPEESAGEIDSGSIRELRSRGFSPGVLEQLREGL